MISMLILAMLMKGMMNWSVEIAGRLSGGIASAGDIPIKGWDAMKQVALSPARGVVAGALGATGIRKVDGKWGRSGTKGMEGYRQRSSVSHQETRKSVHNSIKNDMFS